VNGVHALINSRTPWSALGRPGKISERELNVGSKSMSGTLAPERTATQRDTLMQGETLTRGETLTQEDALARQDVKCHTCGATLAAAGQAPPGIILRATIPQPIAAALRSAQRLSAREQTVFEFLGAGYDNRSIARELCVSERTVKRHVTVILAKLGLESRLQAGLAALIISTSFPDGAK
jgi:ATP/maltotriose-dependent transcriptional regulator MalT